MTKYRAIISIEFDNEDLNDLAEQYGVESGTVQPDEAIWGEISNLSFGNGWVEQLFEDQTPTIHRLSGGISIQVNEH